MGTSQLGTLLTNLKIGHVVDTGRPAKASQDLVQTPAIEKAIDKLSFVRDGKKETPDLSGAYKKSIQQCLTGQHHAVHPTVAGRIQTYFASKGASSAFPATMQEVLQAHAALLGNRVGGAAAAADQGVAHIMKQASKKEVAEQHANLVHAKTMTELAKRQDQLAGTSHHYPDAVGNEIEAEYAYAKAQDIHDKI